MAWRLKINETCGASGKGTRFTTNAPRIADRLQVMCQGGHERVQLEGGHRTRKSDIYPDELCKDILRGLKRQLEDDDRWTTGVIASVCAVGKG